MHRIIIVAATLSILAAGAASGPVRDARAPSVERLDDDQVIEVRRAKFELGRKHLALAGYDPVAYFPEGGSKPTKGRKDLELEHEGVRYRFAKAEHRDLFLKEPDRYEPAYGGWCAYAMAKDDYTEPNPKRYVIQNERLMLFYDGWLGDTLDDWNQEGPDRLEPLADAFWRSEVEKAARKALEG